MNDIRCPAIGRHRCALLDRLALRDCCRATGLHLDSLATSVLTGQRGIDRTASIAASRSHATLEAQDGSGSTLWQAGAQAGIQLNQGQGRQWKEQQAAVEVQADTAPRTVIAFQSNAPCVHSARKPRAKIDEKSSTTQKDEAGEADATSAHGTVESVRSGIRRVTRHQESNQASGE